MTIIDDQPGAARGGLVGRIKGIILSPRTEWALIDAEPATVQGLYTRYVCIVAAVPAVAMLIGTMVFGLGIPGLITVRLSPVAALTMAISNYVLSLIGVAVMALVIEALAPSFGAQKNRVQAFKVSAYGFTAAWLAGIFYLFPPLLILSIVGLYSLYLLWLGLPVLTKAPEDKKVGYYVVTLLIAIVIMAILSSVQAAIQRSAMGMSSGMGIARNTAVAPAVVTVGGQRIDVGRMQAAAEKMESAANRNGGQVQATPPDTLKALLPGDLGAGYARSEVSASSAGAAGFGGSTAEARYAKGDSSIRVNVTDMAAAGALASLGSAFGVSSSKETATGYEKVGVVNGRMTTEEYDRQNRSGKYAVMIGERFMVEAEGQQVAMDDLKHAVGAIDTGRLESLAKG